MTGWVYRQLRALQRLHEARRPRRQGGQLNARPRTRYNHVECLDESGECSVYCTGADTIISLEPLAYSLQRRGTRINKHCDYVIVVSPRTGADHKPCILLVEIDPLPEHSLQELHEKMMTCRRIAECIVEALAPNAHGYRIVEVIVASHTAGKTPEARISAKQGRSIANCRDNILKTCKQ